MCAYICTYVSTCICTSTRNPQRYNSGKRISHEDVHTAVDGNLARAIFFDVLL